jgi:glycosyltransferase involved in cell wall biosynthesis
MGFDVAYFVYPFGMAAPDLPMPIVATPHDFNYKRFATLGPSLRRQFETETPGWLARSARLVVSSNFIAGELDRFYPGFADKVRVVRPGVPASPRTPTAAEAEAFRRGAGLPERFLLSSGWLVPHKNQKVLFEALALLKSRGLRTTLVCVGPNSVRLRPEHPSSAGSYVGEILALCDRLGLEHGRDYVGLGYVDDFDLDCLYRTATVFVMPTLYEAGSLPVREAMLAGCPIVCSRIPTILEDLELLGGGAETFEPTDPTELASAIERQLDDPAGARERTRRAAARLPLVYDWRRMASGYLAVFGEAIGAAVGDRRTGAPGRERARCPVGDR